MKSRLWIAGVFTALLCGCNSSPYPLRQNESVIRSTLLSRWPLGANLADVKKNVSADKIWLLSEIDRSEEIARKFKKPEGRHIMSLVLGHYQGFPFRVDVIAYLGFTDDRLVDCVIEKQYDGL